MAARVPVFEGTSFLRRGGSATAFHVLCQGNEGGVTRGCYHLPVNAVKQHSFVGAESRRRLFLRLDMLDTLSRQACL